MKVQVSFTTKTITILLAMVLTVTIVVSALLIKESEASLLLQQRESQVSHQRRIQLFEEVLHNRMINLIDVVSQQRELQYKSLDELKRTLDNLSDYFTLNFQVEELILFDEAGPVGQSVNQSRQAVEQLVRATRNNIESRSTIFCAKVCTHYMSIPLMSSNDTIPVVVVSTSLRELLYLFNRAAGVHKVAIVKQGTDESSQAALSIASQLSAANRQYITQVFDSLPPDWSINRLTSRGVNITLGEQQLLISLLPFSKSNANRPYLLLVQDVTAVVQQTKQYQAVVVGSAIVLFLIFTILLYLFLNGYKRRLLSISERLPLLADHKFYEFHAVAAKQKRLSNVTFVDELDVVENAANNLAKQLEDFDGQMAINTAKLEKMAMFDALTGLPNRNMLTFQIEKQLARSFRDEKLVALMFMDLDDFKKVNDSHGHDVGDALLKAAAMRISRPIRESDIASRFGGDEFVVLLSDIEERTQVDDIANKLINEFATPIIIEGYKFYISVSIGIAITSHSQASPVELLRHADIAMYAAKSKQGAAYRVYEAKMNLAVMQKVELESEAREALRENQFSLALQPQVAMKSGKVIGFEALLRWYHPTKGAISPADFIPLLENTTFMLELDYWVIARACSLIQELGHSGFPDIKVAINVSAGQFIDPSLPDYLQQQIERNEIAPEQVCLELTETVLVSDIKRARDIMQTIRNMGCMLAIDDFGTGYSSLSYLKSLPADYIKIDRSFVSNITNDTDDRNIVNSTVSMVRNMGMQVVAEGIETQAQYDLLCDFECDYGQGYMISKPIPEHQVWSVLNKYVEGGYWKLSKSTGTTS
ncbi:GGDEF-domain containing protein [Alteromonas sp. MB-3u-76]|uniref:putative bifunctional diguanylate cyclase/phosphodiesterase n=1 Tax=unclassified Alteromonas TaxID=2614992 RepID=UPI000904351F|nr:MULTISPECIES: EAL domain-containing protein [unclassified Alteromonas]APE04412.1 GGDEF-domain containing protein [Alteromonas sp. RW2A1]AUC86819.1 GGDEF-domain containing protein [Alteromonas sp. MB-3u-76]